MVIGGTFNRLVKLGRLRENPVTRVTKGKEVELPSGTNLKLKLEKEARL